MTATERQERKERRRQRLQNISPGLGSSLYITLGLIKLVLGAILLLLIAEWIFPKYVHIFNYSLSDRTFEELKAAQTAGEKESEKRVEALERSVRFLTRGVESMKQPEKFLEQLKQRAERRREPDGAKRPEEKE